MRKLILFVIALVLSLFLFHQWWNRFPPFDGHSDPVDVGDEQLNSELDAVRVRGLAHHAVKVSRVDPGGLLKPSQTYWVWPIFAPGDSGGKRIKTMVASLTERYTSEFEELVRSLRAKAAEERRHTSLMQEKVSQ